VTRVVTEGFGAKGGEPAATEFELRASWSPGEPEGEHDQPSLAGHVAAWCDALCAAAGLPPYQPGVSALPPPAARHRTGSERNGNSGAGGRSGTSGPSGDGGNDARGPAVT
jgi:Protein of unknown function (DUF3000)